MLTTCPFTLEPTGYFSSMCIHGFSDFCFSPRATFSFSLSMPSIVTSISSSIANNSEGWLILPQLISVMCKSPSSPPKSIKAPKSAMFFTTPFLTCPTSISDNNSCFFLLRSSSISFLLETTIFCRASSIFSILHVTSRPMY